MIIDPLIVKNWLFLPFYLLSSGLFLVLWHRFNSSLTSLHSFTEGSTLCLKARGPVPLSLQWWGVRGQRRMSSWTGVSTFKLLGIEEETRKAMESCYGYLQWPVGAAVALLALCWFSILVISRKITFKAPNLGKYRSRILHEHH